MPEQTREQKSKGPQEVDIHQHVPPGHTVVSGPWGLQIVPWERWTKGEEMNRLKLRDRMRIALAVLRHRPIKVGGELRMYDLP